MNSFAKLFALAALFIGAATTAHAQPNGDAPHLYETHCAICHGAGRLGGSGPALLPENLGRMRGPVIEQVIAEGRAATQMPAFSEALSKAQRESLAAFIATPLAQAPRWGADEIAASRTIEAQPDTVTKPVYDADPLNLFVVVEAGDHHVTILDGDRLEALTRFPTRFALHGGPKFSSDGRFVYFMSRDGWVEKYDLWTLKKIGEVRAGVNSRNIALSSDGRTIAVANYLPHTLTLLDAETLTLKRLFDVVDAQGASSRVSAVYQARPRDSFILALKDSPEIWEIDTKTDTHALRRIRLDEPLDDFFFDMSYEHVMGSARDGAALKVYGLDDGRQTAALTLPGLPHLGSGVNFRYDGRPVMATPHLKSGMLSVIAMDDWSVVKTVATPGPGFFLRSHENSPFAWTDSMMSPAKDKMTLLDKSTLEVTTTLTPSPGKTAAHVEFDRRGEKALVSIWEDPGELIVYDARTLEVIKRMPMRKPSGKYNVFNKITFSEGTSH
jgi:mono/diheme cytochrome c family protein